MGQPEGSRGTALQQQRERSANMSLQRDRSLLSGPSSQISVPSLGKYLCLSEKPACTRLFATTASCRGQRTTSVLPAPEDQFPDHLFGATKDKKCGQSAHSSGLLDQPCRAFGEIPEPDTSASVCSYDIFLTNVFVFKLAEPISVSLLSVLSLILLIAQQNKQKN